MSIILKSFRIQRMLKDCGQLVQGFKQMTAVAQVEAHQKADVKAIVLQLERNREVEGSSER